MTTLDDATIDQALDGELAGWERDGDLLRRTYEADSFPDAIAFVGRIAERAEAADHHPDLHISYRTVTVELTTHSEGGITRRDLSMAAEVDRTAP